MPLEFNVGELANRVRRALGVRGRIPLTLDETVVQVAVAEQLNAPPFRLQDGIEFFVQLLGQETTVAAVQRIWFGLDATLLPSTNLRDEQIVAVVEDVWLQDASAVTATGVPTAAPRTATGYVLFNQPGFPYILQQIAHTTERYQPEAGGATGLAIARLPLLLFKVSPADTSGAAPFMQQLVPASEFGPVLHWHGQIALSRQVSMMFDSTFATTATDRSRLNLAIRGRFYPTGLQNITPP